MRVTQRGAKTVGEEKAKKHLHNKARYGYDLAKTIGRPPDSRIKYVIVKYLARLWWAKMPLRHWLAQMVSEIRPGETGLNSQSLTPRSTARVTLWYVCVRSVPGLVPLFVHI